MKLRLLAVILAVSDSVPEQSVIQWGCGECSARSVVGV
jgi:hypothetical protein